MQLSCFVLQLIYTWNKLPWRSCENCGQKLTQPNFLWVLSLIYNILQMALSLVNHFMYTLQDYVICLGLFSLIVYVFSLVLAALFHFFFFSIQVAKTLSTGVHPKKLNWKIHCSLIFTGTWNIVNCSYGNKIARLDIYLKYTQSKHRTCQYDTRQMPSS